MIEKDKFYSYLQKELKNHDSIKYEFRKFTSGAIMLDIWKDDDFFVIQIDDHSAGLSRIDDEPAFTTVPDKSYTDLDKFQRDLNNLLGSTSK